MDANQPNNLSNPMAIPHAYAPIERMQRFFGHHHQTAGGGLIVA
jgi:hypothetical protein